MPPYRKWVFLMTQTIFILSLFKHGFKVRWTTAYFVLVGKKTNSVMTYAMCYQLLPFFHLFPKLSKEHFIEQLKLLEQKGYVTLDGDYVVITPQGKERLRSISDDALHGLSRFEDYQVKEAVFRRFLLITQMISEKSYHNKKYMVVENRLLFQNQLAYQWKQAHIDFETLKVCFKEELTHFLHQLSNIESYIGAHQLTGHHITAKTTEQLADMLFKDPFEIELYIESFKSRLCRLSKKEYPWLYYFIMPKLNPTSVIYQTIFEAVYQKVPIEVISQRLGKKEGTIFDYMTEMAIKDAHFPFDEWIKHGEELLSYLMTHPNVGSWQFSEVKRSIPELDFYSYRLFQIKGCHKDG